MTTDPEPDRKPILLTVDDDPGVSRAVARDLRRHYGEAYRVVRTESGPEALETLRELKLRGDLVAVLLADHRMPDMSGLEFLEEAMDLFPHARRALLTAYADTDAAIEAINVVDLDHYLLKPWDPPEEKLYPVVDSLIELWLASDEQPVSRTQVVGHRWSARSFEVRDFLARNSVPYRWLTSEEPEGQRLLAAAGVDATAVPLVVTPAGDHLVDPSIGDLAARVGLSTTPATDFYDVVIVGGGPAGLGAAVYAASEGLRTVLVERRATGGQAGQSSRIENYLGFPDGVTGTQLTDRARRQAHKFGAEILTTRDVVGLDVRPSSRAVRFDDGGEVVAHAVLLATGISYRKLDVPGADALDRPGRLLRFGGHRGPGVRRRRGLHRRWRQLGRPGGGVPGPPRPARHPAGAGRQPRDVDVALPHPPDRRDPEHRGAPRHRGDRGGRRRPPRRAHRSATAPVGSQETVKAGYLFVFIGAAPRTEWLDGVVARDARGFVLTGPDLIVEGRRPAGWGLDRDPYFLEASAPGVFAAGDVRANSVKRVASAVGEGAMAIQLIHGYLEHQ